VVVVVWRRRLVWEAAEGTAGMAEGRTAVDTRAGGAGVRKVPVHWLPQ
jgi:hypothetical protein